MIRLGPERVWAGDRWVVVHMLLAWGFSYWIAPGEVRQRAERSGCSLPVIRSVLPGERVT